MGPPDVQMSGEGGIRTLDPLRDTRFRDARTRPNYATSPTNEGYFTTTTVVEQET